VRVAAKCSFKVWVSSIKASHSFWKRARRPGTEVAVTGRGRTTGKGGEGGRKGGREGGREGGRGGEIEKGCV